VGWFGARDALKFTGFAGRSRTHLAYYAASESQLATDPRANPMSPLERDDFWQSMASLQYTRVLRPGATLTTTAYRNAAGGNFDVLWGGDLYNYNLDHDWHGLLSTLSWSRGPASYAVGAHVSTYARDHFLYRRPDLASRLHDNTGHKAEQGAFMKGTWSRGTVDLTADLQVRRAAFRYEPTPGNGVAEASIDWVFVNPRLGASWRVGSAVTAFASAGRSRREPARSDMLAGADDIDVTNEADLLPLDRVRPEALTDLEAGLRVARGRATVSVNAFAMLFRDEIAPIGAISATGNPLRRNVDRSTRIGVEVESALRATDALHVTGNLTLMRARIAEYEDEGTSTTYRDVPPLLTPAIIANVQAAWRATEALHLTLGARHVGRSHLANDGNDALVLPAHTLVDGAAAIRLRRHEVRLHAQNLFDASAYTNGYTDGVTRYLFPVASRTLLATVSLSF
jgi:iron complex outermembrane receptor protein